MIHKGLRVGLVMAILVGALALVPAVSADDPCTGKVVTMPSYVAWGASFEVKWEPVTGAAGYALTVMHGGGSEAYGWLPTSGTSVTLSTNDMNGPQATITINALTPEGDILCTMGGTVGLGPSTSSQGATTLYAPPETTQPLAVWESAGAAAREAAGEVPLIILDLIKFGTVGPTQD
jgi:hypothetical protein